MKIFFYINILSGGGAERVIANLATAFSKQGHDVGLITSFPTENEYEVDSRVARYVLDGEAPARTWLTRNFLRVVRLRKILASYKPDILISFMSEPNFRSIIATRFSKTKVIVSVRTDPHKEYASDIKWKLAAFLFEQADGIVFQTPEAKACFSEKIQNKSVIIPNMVNEIFYSTAKKANRKNVVTAGRLSSGKNHKLLIEAFAKIKGNGADDLVIYGEGELRSALEEMVRQRGLDGRVFLPGAVTDVAGMLSAAKLFVLSSDYEGMPNALMEAMAMGLPCISTDCPCGGPHMLIEDGKDGLLVPVNDAEALAQAIQTLLQDEALADGLGANAQTKLKKCDPATIAGKWLEYIKQIGCKV